MDQAAATLTSLAAAAAAAAAAACCCCSLVNDEYGFCNKSKENKQYKVRLRLFLVISFQTSAKGGIGDTHITRTESIQSVLY